MLSLKTKKKVLSCLLSLFLILLPVPHPVLDQALASGTETQITTDPADQTDPAIYGDKIVYEDNRNGNYDIYMYNLSTGTETQITTDLANQNNPAIYGDKIVWEDWRNANGDIYMYDLTTGTETQITTDSADQVNPAIYGDKIVYTDTRNGNDDIYMYDLTTGTETQITTDPAHQSGPAIYGDKIVWTDARDKVNYTTDIYMYDLNTGTETQITTDPGNQNNTKIYGEKIIWMDDRNSNLDIYMYDLSSGTETPVVADPTNQYWPAIYGDKIVYLDDSSYIYMYDLTTGIKTMITTDPNYYPDQPDIYGDKIVWEDWRDTVNWTSDIYMFTLAQPDTTPPAVIPSVTGGIFREPQVVTFTTDEPATVYYTTDGSDPTVSGIVYSEPITIDNTTALKYYAVDGAGNASAVETQNYVIDTVAPTITATPAPGTYTSPQTVTLTADEPATIMYSFDNVNWAVYAEPVNINNTVTLYVYGTDVVGNASPIQTLNYTINISTSTSGISGGSSSSGTTSPTSTEQPQITVFELSSTISDTVIDPTQGPSFSDTSYHWATKEIATVQQWGLMRGYNNQFFPDRNITRAEFVVTLINALKVPDNLLSTDEFADAEKIPQWAEEKVQIAKQLGLIVGYDDNTFRPLKTITRAEMAVIMAKYLYITGQDLSQLTGAVSYGDPLPQWAESAIRALSAAGVVKGYPDGLYRPDKNITRAETAVVACEAIGLIQNNRNVGKLAVVRKIAL